MGKRRKKKRKQNTVLKLILSIVAVLTILIAGVVCFYVSRLNIHNGTWGREIDLTDETCANTLLWLSDINDAEVNEDFVREILGEDRIILPVYLELNQTKLGEGTYKIYIDSDDYAQCEKRATGLAADCLTEIIDKTLKKDTSFDNGKTVNEMAEQILGESLESYLENKELKLISSKEKLIQENEKEGTYTISTNKITWEFEGEAVTEDIVRNKDYIFLPDENVIYRLVKNIYQNEQ